MARRTIGYQAAPTQPGLPNLQQQEMDLFSVVHLAKPTEVKVGTRALKEGEEPVLAAVVGRTVAMDLGEAGESSSVALQATPVQSMPSGVAQTPLVQPTPLTAEHVEETEEAEESPELERKRKRTGDGAATSRKKRPVILSVESSSSDVASRPPSPVTAIPAIEQSAESPPQTSPMRTESSGLKDQSAEPNTAEEVPTGLLIDDLVSLATQIKVKYSGDASQNAEKDKRIASLEAQLATARDEAKTLGTHATKLAEEKMALMCQINQERAEAASYKSTCLWAIKYLENSKDALTTQLEDFGTTVKNALETQEEKLRKLSIEYDEELYPQLLSTIAERRWLISHGLRLAALSVLESQEVRDSFGDVVKCALERGKSEAIEKMQEADLLKVPVEQVPNYDVKAYDNLVAAMEKMKDLELPKIAELERDQDYPINVIFAGLTLARHLGGEAVAQPDYYLRPDASQLQVPVFARPRDILNPFVIDREVPLKQVLEAHAARLAERKGIKGKAVMCGVGAAHLPRSDGVPVSVATVARRDAELLQELNRIGEDTNRVGSSSLKRSHSF